MRKDEFEAKEQTKKELGNQALIKFLLILNTLLIVSFGTFGILASQQGEKNKEALKRRQ